MRSAGGFRLYGAEDERRVRAMQALLAAGVSARQAAEAVLSTPAGDVPAAPATAPSPAGDGIEERRSRLTQTLARFDDVGANAVLDRLLADVGATTVISEVIVPYLVDLGERWADGSATIAEEHFATSLIRGRLLGLARGWDGGSGPRALLACPSGELHDLGLICFGIALRGHGWRITYLGADTPQSTLIETAAQLTPNIIVLAATGRRVYERSPARLELRRCRSLLREEARRDGRRRARRSAPRRRSRHRRCSSRGGHAVNPSRETVGWHVARWGPLGWIETGVKSCAFLCAYVGAGIVDHDRMVDPPRSQSCRAGADRHRHRRALAAIGDRLLEREIVAMVFVCFNNFAHLALLASLLTTAGPGHLLTAFAVLMTCGELVKIQFLRSTGFTVRNAPASTVIGLTAAYALVYALAALVWVWR